MTPSPPSLLSPVYPFLFPFCRGILPIMIAGGVPTRPQGGLCLSLLSHRTEEKGGERGPLGREKQGANKKRNGAIYCCTGRKGTAGRRTGEKKPSREIIFPLSSLLADFIFTSVPPFVLLPLFLPYRVCSHILLAENFSKENMH